MKKLIFALLKKIFSENFIISFCKSHYFISWKKAFKVAVKDSISETAFLDYPSQRIVMEVSSYRQVERLGACRKEPETVRWIEATFKAGDIFYDIGANVGAYSFVAWAVTKGRCRVVAFEPGFNTYGALCKNIALNKADEEIIPLPVALGDETKIVIFNYSGLLPGDALHSIGDHKSGVFGQQLLMYRLDDIMRQFRLPPPTHLKIDVDGGEFSVLRGASRTLGESSLRTVLIEVDVSRGENKQIEEFMRKFNFILDSKYKRKGERYYNFIFSKIS
jgi:FkbM family methyltransferase